MTYLVPQLDGSPNAGDNCGPASIASALRWSTQHDVMPTPSAVRLAMKDPVGGTQMADHAKAYDSFAATAERKGWKLAPAVFHDRDPWEKLLAQVEAGHGMTLAIDYGRVPKHLKGDPKFDGLHAVFVSKVRVRSDQTELRVWDPLCDGRRLGIPRGPVWYPKLTLKAAAAGYAGPGMASWVTIRKATPIGPEPDPCDKALADANREIDRLLAVLEEARSALVNANHDIGAVIADIDAVIPPAPTADGAVREGILPPA